MKWWCDAVISLKENWKIATRRDFLRTPNISVAWLISHAIQIKY